ncbi:MAG: DUF2752 domain-containing protein [Phycisphaerales bacterium]
MTDASASPISPPTAPRPLPGVSRASSAARIGAAIAAAAILAVLYLAATLHADPAGHGTHQQLGLPACGFAATTGHPCPTCGMTTAFTLTAHGRLPSALRTQPGGALACLAATTLLWPCLHTAATGSRALELCGKLLTPKALWTAAAVWLGSWIYTFLTWQQA